jgi:hypothetical protein
LPMCQGRGRLAGMITSGVWRRLLAMICVLVGVGNWALRAGEGKPVVYYDATPLLRLDLEDGEQRRRFWDETHLLVSLQGLVNRGGPRLFLRYVREPDDFWWGQMTGEGGWLAGSEVIYETSLRGLLDRFVGVYRGAVVLDERVPATSNAASTVAGCEDLLVLRWDEGEGSLCRELLRGGRGLEVRVRLLGEGNGVMFTGEGSIPGTELPSTGSAKNDVYRWLVEHYLRSGKANPRKMGYYLDADWLRSWRAAAAVNHTLSNHDYVIAHRGVLFDLNVWEDEACVDDPGQREGTDMESLRYLLRAAWERLEGKAMTHVAGFVPWAFKYTTHPGAGGKHEPVPTEWRYAEILSCFNAYMDADALGLGAMANASFFQHYPLKEKYEQVALGPSRETMRARGFLDGEGRLVSRRYVAHYVGDYDAAAWLYQQLPGMWGDAARGTTPMSWAFNPNLAERFPLGMAYAREQATTNDVFVAGDSGAGYLNPGYLVGERKFSGLPSGLDVWEEHCAPFYRQWDLDVTGFIIDGYGPAMTPEIMDAYGRFSSGGIVAQKVPMQSLHGDLPVMRMRYDLPHEVAEAGRVLRDLAQGGMPQFVVARSILKAPSWYAAVEAELRNTGSGEYQVVDLRTLLWLVREYEHQRVTTR